MELAQRLDICGPAAGDFPQHIVCEHPTARQVAALRAGLAPSGQGTDAGLLARRARLNAFQPLPRDGRVHGVEGRVRQSHGFFRQPAESAEFAEASEQAPRQWQQIAHIVGGVVRLREAQWAAQPVGAGLALLERHAQFFQYQLAVTHLRRMAGQSGGHLRVQHGREGDAGQWQQHFQILARGMQHLGATGVHQTGHQRCQVHVRQRVHQMWRAAVGQLQQGEFGQIGLFAHELRVESDTRRTL